MFLNYKGDDYSALFLVENNISVNLQSLKDKKTALMYLAETTELNESMLELVKKILKSYTIDVNVQDVDGNTALHCAINAQNASVFKEILFNTNSRPNLSIKNKNEQTVLWLALLASEEKSKKVSILNYELIFVVKKFSIQMISIKPNRLPAY